jgi:hypothetical protein
MRPQRFLLNASPCSVKGDASDGRRPPGLPPGPRCRASARRRTRNLVRDPDVHLARNDRSYLGARRAKDWDGVLMFRFTGCMLQLIGAPRASSGKGGSRAGLRHACRDAVSPLRSRRQIDWTGSRLPSDGRGDFDRRGRHVPFSCPLDMDLGGGCAGGEVDPKTSPAAALGALMDLNSGKSDTREPPLVCRELSTLPAAVSIFLGGGWLG